jgi:hypothetical protein
MPSSGSRPPAELAAQARFVIAHSRAAMAVVATIISFWRSRSVIGRGLAALGRAAEKRFRGQPFLNTTHDAARRLRQPLKNLHND